MAINTKRMTINQHWQQVSRDNVTLAGCNTVASYHIHVGLDKPNQDSDFLTTNLAEATAYNFGSPVWVKLNISNTIDEAELIAIGEIPVQPIEVIDNSPNATFNILTNCQYENGALNQVGLANEYAAASTSKRTLNVIAQEGVTNVFFGNSADLYNVGLQKDIMVFLFASNNNNYWTSFVADGTYMSTNMAIATGDELQFTAQDGVLTMHNLTQNLVYTSPIMPKYTNYQYAGIYHSGGQPVKVTASQI